jgi:hypothetical protein
MMNAPKMVGWKNVWPKRDDDDESY